MISQFHPNLMGSTEVYIAPQVVSLVTRDEGAFIFLYKLVIAYGLPRVGSCGREEHKPSRLLVGPGKMNPVDQG